MTRDEFLDGASPNALPLKGPGKVFAWMPPVTLRKLAPFLDGTRWTAKIAGVSLGARWGIFVIWREPKQPARDALRARIAPEDEFYIPERDGRRCVEHPKGDHELVCLTCLEASADAEKAEQGAKLEAAAPLRTTAERRE